MLMTPMSPNTIASPRAMSRRIDDSERPWNAISIPWVKRPQRSIRLIASRAAAAARPCHRGPGAPLPYTAGAQPDQVDRLVHGEADPAVTLLLVGRLEHL